MTSETRGRWIKRIVDLRPGEGPVVFRLFAYLFLIMGAAYLIIPVKMSSVVKTAGPRYLPLIYLGTAVLMSFVALINTRLLRSPKRGRALVLSLVFFIVSLGFFHLVSTASAAMSVLFWLWSEIFMTSSVSQFWVLVHDSLSIRQFKRFAGFFVSGGLLGGIAGSLVTFLRPAKASDPFLISAFALAAGLLVVSRIPSAPAEGAANEPRPAAKTASVKVGYLESFRVVLKNRYLVLLSGMMLTALSVSTIINLQFMGTLAQVPAFDSKAAMQAFVGKFNFVLLIVSYLLQVLFANKVMRRFGMKATMFISPVILAAGALTGFFLPAGLLLAWATTQRCVDKSLTHTLSQSLREILYIPVPLETKHKAKVFIDLFINKLADAFASVLVLIFGTMLGLTIKQWSFLVLGLILVWGFLNLRIFREYVGIVKKNLTIKWPDADKLVFDQIDVDATKLVFDTLESKQRSSVLYAMNLMDLIKKDKLSPELKRIIAGKSSEVRAGALDTLLDVSRETQSPDWEDVVDDKELGQEVQEILSLGVYQDLMKEQVQKITEDQSDKAVVSQMEIAKALGMMAPDSPLVHNLAKLLRHDSPEVVRYALESAGRQKKREFVPLIMAHLTRPATSQAATRALLEYGDKIAGTLKDYLADESEDLKLRRSLPEILAQMKTQRAANMLMRVLRTRAVDVQAEVIEALVRVRSWNPSLVFGEDEVGFEVGASVRKACILVLELFANRKDSQKAVLAAEHESALARTLKQIFGLLSLVYPSEDVMRAYQNYREGTKRSMDYALELLENMLKRDVKEALLPLLEERPLDEKAAVCRKILKTLEKRPDPGARI